MLKEYITHILKKSGILPTTALIQKLVDRVPNNGELTMAKSYMAAMKVCAEYMGEPK